VTKREAAPLYRPKTSTPIIERRTGSLVLYGSAQFFLLSFAPQVPSLVAGPLPPGLRLVPPPAHTRKTTCLASLSPTTN